jgi:hypothetical protein
MSGMLVGRLSDSGHVCPGVVNFLLLGVQVGLNATDQGWRRREGQGLGWSLVPLQSSGSIQTMLGVLGQPGLLYEVLYEQP